MGGHTIVKVATLVFIAAVSTLPAKDAVAQASGESREVVRAGAATLHIVVRGQGHPVVFIPASGRGVEDFDGLSRRLVQAGYRAVLPQPRGIGESTGPLTDITLHDLASDIAAVIQALGGGPATVLGHAFGNRVARVVATDHPKLVKQVILLAAGGMVPMSAATAEVFDRVFNETLPEDEWLTAIQRLLFARGNPPGIWDRGWHFGVGRAQRSAAVATPANEWWAGGSVPILVLQGIEDIIAVPENSRRLAAEYPDRVTVVDIPKAGHAMLPEQPDRIAAAILAYLGR